MNRVFPTCRLAAFACALLLGSASAQSLDELIGTSGGFAVQVGIGSGDGLATLAANPRFTIHGLDENEETVRQTRQRLLAANLYGRIAVDRWDGRRLPYANGMVNLLLDEGNAPENEVRRVLAPLGVHLRKTADGWRKTGQPWPEDIDEWTHYLHSPGNNAVAADTRIGPPRSLQWQAPPRWARHHDRLASMSALVTAAGRMFYILDEGPTSSILLPADWQLVARDAFNGSLLWKQPYTFPVLSPGGSS